MQIKEAQLNPDRASASIIGGSVIEKLARRRLESAVCDLQQDALDLQERCETAEAARDKFQGRNNALRRKIRAKDVLIDQHRLKIQKLEALLNP